MAKIDWSRANQIVEDPARAQRIGRVLPPDEPVVKIIPLSPKELRVIAKRERSNKILRQELEDQEKRRKRERRAANRKRNKAIFAEDAIREARLKRESEARRLARQEPPC